MRVLLFSHWFYPSYGGVETVTQLLAQEFVRAGVGVTVMTQTPGEAMELPFAVVRRPSAAAMRQLAREHDILLQNTISLRSLLPVMGCGKPVVVIHQSWLRLGNGRRGWENYMKLAAVRLCRNVAISRAIGADLPVTSTVIGNPFDASEFEGLREAPRDRDIVFMGRLVPDKGVDTLLAALQVLQGRGLRPSVTVVGDGPDLPALRAMVAELGLEAQVEFAGAMREGRGRVVARHRVMAVPSRWAEPFGIVALEGIAAGCALVASEQGGLPDAAGPCAVYFPNENVGALADRLQEVLSEPGLRERLVAAGPEHLRGFQPAAVAGRYVELFHRIIRG
jgi:glycosyltransferase involved in cell wall biosynthesis